VTAHRITYEGPAAMAVRAATLIADAEGVELTSAESPEPLDGRPDIVRLRLVISAAGADAAAAVQSIQDELPPGATVSIGAV